jgi:hypothetical protein
LGVTWLKPVTQALGRVNHQAGFKTLWSTHLSRNHRLEPGKLYPYNYDVRLKIHDLGGFENVVATVFFLEIHQNNIFFIFKKIIFDISTSKQFKNIKK